ncbi:hypothetical protein [Bradyrhizobium canariense]|uniref:hypothetical protein n=1 Tax=Bradyrhizobium canariense TaxID=255045 RepID=UPI0013028088|nr:hypothetical protein [Bradyrhizobium canariense]
MGNVNNCGLPAKIKTGWESKAKEIVVAIARPANGPLGEMFAASCDPPVSTRIAWASKVKVTVAVTERHVAAGACSENWAFCVQQEAAFLRLLCAGGSRWRPFYVAGVLGL